MMLDIKHLLANKILLSSAAIYTCLITVVLLMPTSDLPSVDLPKGVDKSVHFLIHFVLVMLWQLYWFQRNSKRFLWRNGVIVLIGSFLYGTIIEILQGYLTVSRTADLFDILANFFGALVGVLVFQKVKHFITP